MPEVEDREKGVPEEDVPEEYAGGGCARGRRMCRRGMPEEDMPEEDG